MDNNQHNIKQIYQQSERTNEGGNKTGNMYKQTVIHFTEPLPPVPRTP
jgi:hypothetical protein